MARFLLICVAWPVCSSILSDKRSLPISTPYLQEANKAVAKVLESTSEKASRGKYNSYTSVQRDEIGKYAAENGATNAAKHFFKCREDHLAALSNHYCLWIICISTFLFAHQ